MHHSMLPGHLLFRLGSNVLLFHHKYFEYLRAANATGAHLPVFVL